MHARNLYYAIRPFIPRTLQIYARRAWCKIMRLQYHGVWPIDPRAGKLPRDWPGWPDGKQFGLILTHDVDTLGGLKRCRQLADLDLELGFRSSFNFVPERYPMDASVHGYLNDRGFEIGVHDLNHDGKLLSSRTIFADRAVKINGYLKQWNAVGFRAAAMHHNLEWFRMLNIEYDLSTFDTDPFEPQCDGVGTIFPFWVGTPGIDNGYWEIPYTLPQDFTTFVLMGERTIDLWKRKLAWVVDRGGLALVNAHPDYMAFQPNEQTIENYPVSLYRDFLQHVKATYAKRYWHGLPKDLVRHCRTSMRSVERKAGNL
ncbi:MAG: hypothetical protein AUK55_14345 [Syntrophobacteraceae bacterium CG2_30_61_12]|nr:MAG: hypothetical protein AUK55_14345 [Syntrophobacteraceae bacterium CG2_30_61_12]PIU31968.1 MAG: hypothetical protein COT06_05270 [Syntrophobacteraceae bacterium CG07_land_8_20_14_0_80_61_8]